MKGDVYKPYPYVFSQGSKSLGIGMSGPGGLLWPNWPPRIDTPMHQHGSIPTPVYLHSIDFSDINIGETTSVSFSTSLSPQNLLSSLDSVGPEVEFYTSFENADLYPEGTGIESIEESLGAPLIYLVFAYDGEVDGITPPVLAQLEHTTPFEVLIGLGGCLTPEPDLDSRTSVVSFNHLVCKIRLQLMSQGYEIAEVDWYYKYTTDSDWTITVTHTDNTLSGLPMPTLNIEVKDIIVVSHPDKSGTAIFYWGGLVAHNGFSSICPVQYEYECDKILGPIWLPHTTFYPLVDAYRPDMSADLLPSLGEADPEFYSQINGYGILARPEGLYPAEQVLAYSGQLLYYPQKINNRGYGSFQPDYADTRIIQDTCIYPVVGPLDTNQIKGFEDEHKRATSSF